MHNCFLTAPGIGKTTLALGVAHYARHRHLFKMGIAAVSLADCADMKDVHLRISPTLEGKRASLASTPIGATPLRRMSATGLPEESDLQRHPVADIISRSTFPDLRPIDADNINTIYQDCYLQYS